MPINEMLRRVTHREYLTWLEWLRMEHEAVTGHRSEVPSSPTNGGDTMWYAETSKSIWAARLKSLGPRPQ